MNRRTIVWGVALGILGAVGMVGAHRLALADDVVENAPAEAQGEWAGHGFVLAALKTVSLRPEQQTQVDQLEADLRARAAPVRAAHGRVMEAVATSVEAGTYDHATIDPLVVAVRATIESSRPGFEDAANRLHSILDASQRRQLISGLRDQLHAGHGGFLHRMGGERNHLEQVARELGLSDGQRSKIRANVEALRDREHAAAPEASGGFREHFAFMKSVADAFTSDSFDAHALGLAEHLKTAHVADRMLSRIEASIPVLTPAQRAQLATMIRSKQVATTPHA